MRKFLIALTLGLAIGLTNANAVPKKLTPEEKKEVKAQLEEANKELKAAMEEMRAAMKEADTSLNMDEDKDEAADSATDTALSIDNEDILESVKTPVDTIKDLVEPAVDWTAIVVVVTCGMLLPVLVIALILYFVYRNRQQRYHLMEKAIENGQPIPQELLSVDRQTDDYLRRKGIKNAFLGLGLVVFFHFIGAGFLQGIGALVLIYGLGQLVIAYTSPKKKGNENTTGQDNPDIIEEQDTLN